MLSSIWIFSFFLITVITSNDTKLYIDGITLDGWEFVRDLFKENFVKGLDLGGSVAIYHEGELVVDLWGGWFNKLQNIGQNIDRTIKKIQQWQIYFHIVLVYLHFNYHLKTI